MLVSQVIIHSPGRKQKLFVLHLVEAFDKVNSSFNNKIWKYIITRR